MESTETISPPSCCAKASAMPDLPTAVGPARISGGGDGGTVWGDALWLAGSMGGGGRGAGASLVVKTRQQPQQQHADHQDHHTDHLRRGDVPAKKKLSGGIISA